ncbi:MAG: ABC transporter permease [Bacteroidales bacterium]|nr:ABC transporter permease [Bacteroidales bacterium]
MLLNYLITAWRNLLKFRAVSAINILGLTLGLASALIAIIYARHELSFENCHEKADRICRIYLTGNFGQVQQLPTSMGPEGEALKQLFPEIEAYTIARSMSTTIRVGENLFKEDDIIFSDSLAFSIFTIPFQEGNASSDPQTVVLSEQAARRYFGKESPVGKNISMNCYGNKCDFLVTGVFYDFPSNTHIQGDFIIPLSFSKRFGSWKYNEYLSTNYNTYVLLQPGTNVKALNAKIAQSYKIPVDIENLGCFLMPLKDIHLRGSWENNKGKLIVFLIGGLFVLITSCLNYINLTNILFSTRSRETGIRKVNGGSRTQIMIQFFVDTLLSVLISFNLAILLLQIILPWFNAQMDTHISLKSSGEGFLLMASVFIVSVLLSGIYPAFKFSARKPVFLMKSETAFVHGKGISRWILTTFQFFLAVIFIQVIMVMEKQNWYLNRDDIKRFNPENVICVNGYPWGDLKKVKTELLKNPSIEYVSWGSSIPSMGYNVIKDWKEKDNNEMAVYLRLAPDYTKVYQIQMKEGRFLSYEFPSDREKSVVINLKAVNELGYTDPLNKQILLNGKQYTIVGIIDDYMAFPPIFDNMPVLITQSRELNDYLVIRIKPQKSEEVKNYITGVLKQFNGDYPIELKYHNEVLYGTPEAKSYISAGKLMSIFFIITIITSLIGIFGLSLFISQRNQKKVGIMKVCGASVGNVLLKLTRGIIIQVIIAILLATPVTYMFTGQFLASFPRHVEPGLIFLLSGGLMALVMVLITIYWQTWKTAIANPVESLKYE